MSARTASGSPLDRERVAAARLWAVNRYPFLAAAVFATEIIERPGIATVATDTRFRLYLDGAFVRRLSTPNLGRLIVHHVGHLLRLHAERARETEVGEELGLMWVRACDAEINDDLPREDLLPLHVRSLPQSFGAQPGQFAEDYFAHLQARHGPRWRPWARDTQVDCGSSADGRPRAWDEDEGGVDDAAGALIRMKVAAAVRDHAGTDPDAVGGAFQRWADGLLGGRVDWRRLLAAEIRRSLTGGPGASDYTYRRPSRRAASAPGVILASLHQPAPSLAVVCDTSASMDQALLDEALSEIETIIRTTTDRRATIPVIACDTEVRAVRLVNRAAHVELTGGGGTDLRVGIAAAAELRPRPSVLVVLTDGNTEWPTHPPAKSRVIVGLMGRPEPGTRPPPPWARVIGVTRDRAPAWAPNGGDRARH